MPRRDDVKDPKGLIYESYRIDGIGEPECRSIFLDWAIGVPVEADSRAWIAALLESHGRDHPDHPMTHVLREALVAPQRRGRRGGASGRRADQDG